eukprot:jgi/Mesvir1/24077/Mv10799-RA.1
MKRNQSLVGDDSDLLEITPLGAGNEVGRSCVVLTYQGKTVMFDCGIHPAYGGMAALPFFDEIDPSTVDLLLITHFHLDHCASLPYFLEKTTFKGKVYMTHSTKAIYRMLLSDFVKVSKVGSEDMLYDEADLQRTMEKIEVIDFHSQVEENGIRFWCYQAGHVLGAAMFLVDIAGMRVLYTGDYSREEDRHLRAAEMPEVSPDVCIIESTYGVQTHQPRRERERRFTDLVVSAVSAGGRVLIPVFALGRAQELLLILEEYWEAHPEVQHVPIYYASPLAKRCMLVYQTYISAMNDKIRAQFDVSNPWVFKHIDNLKSMDHFSDVGPSVVMASPGMLQSGLSRQLFDMWCQDKRNACIIPGYCVEGTLAKHILSEPKEVALSSGLVVPLNMRVHYISFSAHADFTQTSEFLDELRPPNIILVHGEATEMGRLKAALTSRFANRAGVEGPTHQPVQVLTPKNCQTVQMHIRRDKTAKAVGRLAAAGVSEGDSLSGFLVKKDFAHTLMVGEELNVYTQLITGNVTQRLHVPFTQPLASLQRRLELMFEAVEPIVAGRELALAGGGGGGGAPPSLTSAEPRGQGVPRLPPGRSHQPGSPATPLPVTQGSDDGGSKEAAGGEDGLWGGTEGSGACGAVVPVQGGAPAEVVGVRVHGTVTVRYQPPTHVVLEWQSDPVSDTISDAIVAIVLQAEMPSHPQVRGAGHGHGPSGGKGRVAGAASWALTDAEASGAVSAELRGRDQPGGGGAEGAVKSDEAGSGAVKREDAQEGSARADAPGEPAQQVEKKRGGAGMPHGAATDLEDGKRHGGGGGGGGGGAVEALSPRDAQGRGVGGDGGKIDVDMVEERAIYTLLESMFGKVQADADAKTWTVAIDDRVVVINHSSKEILCDDPVLKDRLRVALRRVETSLYPIDAGC